MEKTIQMETLSGKECMRLDDINLLLQNTERTDNILWQVCDSYEYRRALPLFLGQGDSAKKHTVLISFSEVPVILQEDCDKHGIHVIRIPLTPIFETFTVTVYRAVKSEPEGTLFLFDSLSDLQTAWATDLMMENFFRVITPAIRENRGIAYFPLARGMHSFHSTSAIQDMTELVFDLYSDERHIYLRPHKLAGYSSGDAFLPHVYQDGIERFAPIADGVLTSRFHRAQHAGSSKGNDLQMDSWDRFFDMAQRDHVKGHDISDACSRMCDIMMSRDPKMRTLIKAYFQPEDYFYVRERMIGTGLIGGKASGMLAARRIIEKERPDLYERLEPHDSFFIGSDVFYSYIVENDLWGICVRQRTGEEYFSLAENFAERLKQGVFSEQMREEFRRMLECYGQIPVIVRSSSILEDGFGNAFAGKYESVFCANSGSMEERLNELEQAIRTVYASALGRSALDYRRRRGLDLQEEQMAILVQRVSGSHYGPYFMPGAAGVGYSYSTYRFLESLAPEAGMLRLVMGLGTSAVDRTEGSYPRLVSLDKPEALPYTTRTDHHRHAQQSLELIDKKAQKLTRVPLKPAAQHIPDYLKRQLLSHDYEAERMFRERGERRDVTFITCDGLVKNQAMMQDMRDMLSVLQRVYEQPVDIEFTINLSEEGEYIINLLQCRPLQAFRDTGKAVIPEEQTGQLTVLDCRNASMGNSGITRIDAIVYVDPVGYYKMPHQEKTRIARLIGELNWKFRGQGKKLLLMVPGRIGTSSPELGVPVNYADISEFAAIFEMSVSEAGYRPELSYGSHMFQDLVENETLYCAVFEDHRTVVWKPEILNEQKNQITEKLRSAQAYESILNLYQMQEKKCFLYHDLAKQRLVLRISD